MSTETTAIQAVQLVQLPILEDQITEYAKQLKGEIEELNLGAIVPCAETIAYLKDKRAEYNKKHAEVKEAIKRALAPAKNPVSIIEEKFQ